MSNEEMSIVDKLLQENERLHSQLAQVTEERDNAHGILDATIIYVKTLESHLFRQGE